ncbi:DHH family phosphoesterase [archaeon]|jgi:single-stranded-DNA-specific exonuclease|nr:DHH family phosphoesterase [archaeon]
MEEVNSTLKERIKQVANKFLKNSKNQEIQIISHFDTDGITSATIMLQSLKKLDQKFTLKIVKSLDEKFIQSLNKEKITLFLDLASGSLNHIKNAELKEVYIIDHHEISSEIPEEINFINPEIFQEKQRISGAGLTYLFCKELDPTNKEFAKLAILGMIGDSHEKEIDTLNHEILDEGEIIRKKGLLIYPSTRPLNRTLEYSSYPYIPEVTGNIKGVLELLREAGLKPEDGKYKSLIELNEKEMEKLTTAVMLRSPDSKNREIVGKIFLIKLFNKLEDAREISAKINACSRYGEPETAIGLCMEIPKAKRKAESIHVKHRQSIIAGLKTAKEIEKVEGKLFTIINAKEKIKDTIIGTIASILSNSTMYEEGTIITTMGYCEDKIKISSRIAGRNGRNVRELLSRIINEIGGEVGGHAMAAGGMISQEKEEEFIQKLKKQLEIEMVKVVQE